MEASDGEQAMRVFKENTAAIDLVFLDMTMPGISGPPVKARLASGYAAEVPGAHFLAKPYSPLDLVRRIQEIMNSTEDAVEK